ncbi:hypothetical protein LVY72_04325 [Arthrobacter sp. I2-34]|uniref:Uncharacterized protein n=1 Tax=Arthrobacter hankyongi TaxID=2904801 RepID=A0ABS9L3J6_9MICC|nr:hypothetical protein [Arthrobacter hankyongi]MCG2621138.1 hypothetical protein [Arthrobacter hankyongi]
MKVSATLVKHPPVFPAFGFRFDTDNGSVVFSGDTGACEGSSGDLPASIIDHLAESHTVVNEVGALAEAAGMKNLVPGAPEDVTDGQWTSRAQRGYSGRVHVGRDLMMFKLGASRQR